METDRVQRGDPSRHALERGVVLEERQIAYIPVPKAACTSMLWILAEVAGISREAFWGSSLSEVTRALTVHDMSVWGDERRLGARDPDWLDRIAADDWLIFSVVREPCRRLWSAWQSKLLLREPQFVRRFAEEPWFPGPPQSGRQIVDDFRAFLMALRAAEGERPAHSHWAPQSQLLSAVRSQLTHVGRVDRLEDTIDRLRRHVGRPLAGLTELPRENTTSLEFSWSLFDPRSLEVVREVYASDLENFDFPLLELEESESDIDGWIERVTPQIPAMRALAERNARIGDLAEGLVGARREQRELRDQMGSLEVERARVESHNVELRFRNRGLDATLAEFRRRLTQAQNQRRRADKRRRRAERRVAQLLESGSWKVTAPLRKGSALLRRRARRRPSQERAERGRTEICDADASRT